jgi:4-hydroxy-2-oxoheptanedioate aldolase
MYRENRLKKLINDNKKALGCWSSLDNSMTTEILALAGFDFLLFDQEHGLGNAKGLVHQFQALSATPATSMVRVPSHDPHYVKWALDAGAECLMFPSVNTAEQARAIVKHCRYAPHGSRGMAPGMIRATNYGMEAGNYVETASDNLMIICQIETIEAIDNIAEIGAVDGVDMLFIGPNDLSCAIKKFGQYEDPEFTDLMARAEEGIRASGKQMGTIPYGKFGWQEIFDRGYSLTTGGTEVALLRQAAVDIVNRHHDSNR